MTATTTDKPDTRSLRHKDAMCDRARGRAYRLPTLPFRPLSPVASPLGAHRCYIRLFAADLGRLKLNLRHRRYPRDSLDRARPVVELSLRPDRIGAAHLLCVFQCQSSVWFRQNASDRRTDSACRASSGRVSVSSHQYVSSFLQVACAHSTPVSLAIDGLPVWPLGLAQSLSGGGAWPGRRSSRGPGRPVVPPAPSRCGRPPAFPWRLSRCIQPAPRPGRAGPTGAAPETRNPHPC